MSSRSVIEDYGTHGTTATDSGPVRGVGRDNDTGWVALTNTDARYFKTVDGAVRFLARFGYDSYGCSVERKLPTVGGS